nr:hypothetical protein [Tanacetum cinerariifolium]
MNYPRFTKVIIDYFMTRKPTISRRNRINWHYVRDDALFSTIKVVSRHQTTQQYGTILPIELTTDEIRNNDDDDDQNDNDDDQDTENDGDDFVHPKLSIHEEEAKYEESFDPIVQTPKNSDEGNDVASLGLNVGGEEGHDAEDEDEELYRDRRHTTQEYEDTHVTLTLVNPDGQQQSSLVSFQFVTSMLNPSPNADIDSLFVTAPRVDVQASTTVAPLILTAPTLTPPTIPTISQVLQAPTPPTTAPSTFLDDLPNFCSLFRFDHRLKTLEANFSELRTLEENFSEFMQTNQFAGASDRLYDVAQRENDEFLKTIDENMQKIIKEQVKEQVKALVEAYESDKIILDTYRETSTLKRRRDDDDDKDKEPSAGPDQGSTRCREGKEPESVSAPKEKATRSAGKSSQGSKSRQALASEFA